VVRGAVQGVGFRPFVYRLARELGLQGWVKNSSQGVFIEVEGPHELLDTFLLRVQRDRPPISFIQSLESSFADTAGYAGFEIRESTHGEKTALVMPDVATCSDCMREIFDPQDRRYRYPFTNCTNCGPRFTIIESLPYDRPATTMKAFTMCAECAREYRDPADRRFHAQPNACPACGPQLTLLAAKGSELGSRDPALKKAAEAIAWGQIVAVKGLGGFHLMVDARNDDAVQLLRRRKHREEKPLALMFPSLDTLRDVCEIDALEERLLLSPESPIVLLSRKEEAQTAVASSVAPGNPYLGVMLPYTPLHHLLMRELGFPVVATSGNISDEPICIDNHEALERLRPIADLLLVHDRPILRHADDSIARVVAGRQLLLRRARGFAPLPIQLEQELPPVLALGAHQKNTVAISVGRQVFCSQHIGDLETEQAFITFKRTIAGLGDLYDFNPQRVACDMHPDYMSTRHAHTLTPEPFEVQHHHAHALACLAENGIAPPALGVCWDGSGYGPDGTVWGGEFLRLTQNGFERFAHLRTFRLPGGERAVREPRRCALALLFELRGESVLNSSHLSPLAALGDEDSRVLVRMMLRGVNSPLTSSAGRLFDAVASLTGLRQVASYEGQAAMELEYEATRAECDESYPFALREGSPRVLDWAPMIEALLEDVGRAVSTALIARRFHNTLAEMIVAVAAEAGEDRVALSGGCFQNRLLTELTVRKLEERGLRPYWHQRIPPNDGCIALGQAVAAGLAKDRRENDQR